MKKQVRYNGYNYTTLIVGKTYNVEGENYTEYKIRNENGKLTWYTKTSFIEVKQKVTNGISDDLVQRIEDELKATEERMADLRQQLEDAKTPPTNNILLRETRKNPDWRHCQDLGNAMVDFAEALCNAVSSLTKGFYLGISNSGEHFVLDKDYNWELSEDEKGVPILKILDK